MSSDEYNCAVVSTIIASESRLGDTILPKLSRLPVRLGITNQHEGPDFDHLKCFKNYL